MSAADAQAGGRTRRGPRLRLWGHAVYAPIWRPLAVWIGLVLIVLTYIPLVWLVVMSFSDRPLSGIPHPLTLRWYDQLFATSAWIEPMTDSLWLALAVGACCVLVSVPVGRAIPRMKRRGGVLLITLLPLFVPGLTMGAALFLFIRSYMHFKLGMWSVFVGHMVWALPFAFLLVIVLATRFDHRLLEAAEDLGASAWKRFWQIEFPIMRPGIVGAGLFGFILSFNELLRSIFLRGTETTMPIYTWAQASSHQSNVPIIFGLASLIFGVTLPIIGTFFWILFSRTGQAR